LEDRFRAIQTLLSLVYPDAVFGQLACLNPCRVQTATGRTAICAPLQMKTKKAW
jgi:hypothetical protein